MELSKLEISNLLFSNLACNFSGRLIFWGVPPTACTRKKFELEGGSGPWIRKKPAAGKAALASEKVAKKPAAMKSKRTFILLNLTCSMVGL